MLFTDQGAQKRKSSLGKGKIMRGFCMSLRFQFCPLHFDVTEGHPGGDDHLWDINLEFCREIWVAFMS